MVASVAAPPASAALPDEHSEEKGNEIANTKRGTVAFAQETKEGFDIPSVEEILSREEDPALFNAFTRSLSSSVSKVCPCCAARAEASLKARKKISLQ